MKKLLVLVMLMGFFLLNNFAQDFDKTKLNNYFDTLETHNKFMGSIAISQNGKIIYQKSIGFADLKNKIQADENSKYRIGSISKTFTSVLILKAVEEEKIDLNQTIDKYFPSIKNANKIKIIHLLYHRSGIFNFTNTKEYLTWNSKAKKEKEMIEIISKTESNFEPDLKAEYSNSNYVLLTYILEKIYRKPYAIILDEYIVKPLNLKNTYLGNKINTKNNECNSYRYEAEWILESETNISIPLGAGGIVSTPSDLVRFSDALFTGKLLQKETLEQMKTLKDNFGMALFEIPFYNKIGYGHTGGIDAFSSVFSHFPGANISYALISNGTQINNNDISIAVLSALFYKPFEFPDFRSFSVSSEDLDKYLGVYSSSQIPIKITFTKSKNILLAQATGQPLISLDAKAKDIFKFDQAGVVFEFNPTDNSMILKQGGGQFTFTKE